MADREIETALPSETLARVQREAFRRGISLEEMAGILARNELARRAQPQTAAGSVVPFRRRTE